MIGANAFAGNAFSSHVYIPNESATVDSAAFDATATWAKEGTDKCFEIANNVLSDYYCGRDVTVPDGVITIADNTFKDKGLTSVTFSDSVAEIGANAFTGNTFSSHIYIPNESATVDVMAFDSSVIVAVEGTGSCFEISNNALSAYYCGRDVTVPDGVTSIEANVFENKGLTAATFPETLTNIKANAFKDNDLMDITIPETVTEIGANAFAGNSRLTDAIQILDIDAEIANDAFPNGWYREVEGSVVPDLASLCDSATISQTGCQGENTLTGDSGTEYDIVEIGNQCWFAENLHEVPSNFVPKPTWVNSTHVGWYGYYGEGDSNITDKTNQGYLYQWAAAMNDTSCLADVDCGVSRTQGACPDGWHIPSDCEFMSLEAELGMSESDQATYSDSDHRNSDSSNVATQLKSNGTSGFNITPVGNRYNLGGYITEIYSGQYYWTSDTFTSTSDAFMRSVRSSNTGIIRAALSKNDADYVRCLKD